MNREIIELKERLEREIDNLKIPEIQKKRIQETLLGILVSKDRRLKLNEEQYLTLKKKDEKSDYAFCVEKSGDYNFPSLEETANLVEENKKIVDAEIVVALDYQKSAARDKIKEDKAICKANMKNAIERMEKLSEKEKQRVYDVLDAIENSPNGKITTVRNPEFVETLSLSAEHGVMGYTITSKMIDVYGGSNGFRKAKPVSAKGLAEYIEKNKATIEKEVKKINETKNLSER